MTLRSDEDSQERTPSTDRSIDAMAPVAPGPAAKASEASIDRTLSHGSQASAPSTSPLPAARHQQRDPNRYHIIGEHGRGGLGRVTRAHDLELGRDIAIKELISRGHVSELRFLREALITARLEHPGIVPVYEAGVWPDGTPFYAMKLVAGRPLRALISERTTVEDRLALLHHVIAVTDAIAYAHGRGVIHRDLKPSNVIVGEFGETVVIDWGLAKDLGAPDDFTGVAASPPSTDDGLTSAGSVLGTPAYMAPEQARGESVDQRADVYALGAMLWELGSLVKLPPRERAQRQRALRRNRIDRDLIAIIDKALATDPADRYPHAGALAADLKAFRAGARLASRHYSLLDGLRHAARRHRAVAVSILAALIAVIAGVALYVHGVTAERDRADASNNNLILEHAQSLMASNPGAAKDLLQTYTGANLQRLDMLRAEARERGTSILLGRPHNGMILLQPLADGSVLSVGAAGTVSKTTITGTTRTIARDVAAGDAAAFSPARQLLAYACDHAAVCLLDTRSEIQLPRPGKPLSPFALALSPSGARLAVVSTTGALTIWDLGAAPVLRFEGKSEPSEYLQFLDDDAVLTAHAKHVRVFRVGEAPIAHDLAPEAGDVTTIDVIAGAAALGTADGFVIALDPRTGAPIAQKRLCERVRVVRALDARRVVFGCGDGMIAAWQPATDDSSVLARAASRIDSLTASSDGCCLYAGTRSGQIVAYNFATQLSAIFAGHTNIVLWLQPATATFPYLTSGDFEGNIRVWSLPEPSARLALQTPGPLIAGQWLPGQHALVAYGRDETIYWLERGRVTPTTGHAPVHESLARSRGHVALYGGNDEIELWSTDARHALRSLHTGHQGTYSAGFTADGAWLLVGSEDGALTLWSTGDDRQRQLTVLDALPVAIRECGGGQSLVIADRKRGLWLYEHDQVRSLGREPGNITGLTCVPDGAAVALTTTPGNVQRYDFATGRATPLITSQATLRFATFSPDGRQVAALSENELRVFRLPAAAGTPIAPLDRLELPVRILEINFVTYSADGQWLAVTCNNGDLWFYRRRDARWIYRSTGSAKIETGRFSEDSAQFATADASGRLLLFDMTSHAFHEGSE